MIDKIKKKISLLPPAAKKAAAVLAALLAAGVIVLPVIAWFSSSRETAFVTRVNSPTILYIQSGGKDDVAFFELGDIDTQNEDYKQEDGSYSKDYVFSVCGNISGSYIMQLSHTTNIPFTYTISKAVSAENEGDICYTDSSGEKWYYNKGDKLSGGYLNVDSGEIIANDTEHELTYGDYDNVQKNAEPAYWQSGRIAPSQKGEFADYYILTISWSGDVQNDKETDIVYITAGVSS
jgi:hypothetical protein